jgi:putative membrane protein
MVRRLLGLVLPFAGSATAVWLSTLLFDRDFFHHAVSLDADLTTQARAQTIAIVTVIFGLVNLTVKPVVRFVTWGIRIITFGLFSLVINGAMLFLTGVIANYFDFPFHVGLTWWVIAAAVFIGLVSGVLSWLGDKITAPGERRAAPPPPPPPPPRQYQQPPQTWGQPQQTWDQPQQTWGQQPPR